MEWVETTAKTVDEAKELALDKLGVDETDTEFEILEQPKQGLFGRVRGEARVRARVTPKSPRAKEERRDRKRRPAKTKPEADAVTATVSDSEEAPRSGGRKVGPTQGGANGRGRNGGGSEAGATRKRPVERPRAEDAPMEDVANSVQEFLDGLTAAFGIDTPVTLETDDESIMAHIEGKHGLLLGPKARTLDAIQELTRVTAQRAAPSSVQP